jgi:hypothetical protein
MFVNICNTTSSKYFFPKFTRVSVVKFFNVASSLAKHPKKDLALIDNKLGSY